MCNLEKEIEIKKQLKLARIFKEVISAGLIAPIFISVSDCKKKAPTIKELEETIHG